MPAMLATMPNAGIPAGLKRRAFDASKAKGHAAGVLFVAPDGEVLLCRRSLSETNYAGHWALPGGGVDEGETPTEGAAREIREELGYNVAEDAPWKVLDQKMTPNGLAYHTFAVPVDKKFAPTLNDEHLGYAWVPLDQLPKPLHPAVQQTMLDRVGIGSDMAPEDWSGLRDGLLKWIAEEEDEPEHADDDNGATERMLRGIPPASGAQDHLALDRSMRSFDEDGRMRVKRTHISKANVCPYRGDEIPGWDKDTETHALGLDPDTIYQLLRDPDELRKSIPTWNGIQLLHIHRPVDANDPGREEIVGTTATEAQFDGTYLDNGLIFWTEDGIALVESDEQSEISCGYHYEPDMTPGVFNGEKYDGVMRNIRGNHVAIVEEGRAGPDVMVADTAGEIMWDLLADMLSKAWAA